MVIIRIGARYTQRLMKFYHLFLFSKYIISCVKLSNAMNRPEEINNILLYLSPLYIQRDN